MTQNPWVQTLLHPYCPFSVLVNCIGFLLLDLFFFSLSVSVVLSPLSPFYFCTIRSCISYWHSICVNGASFWPGLHIPQIGAFCSQTGIQMIRDTPQIYLLKDDSFYCHRLAQVLVSTNYTNIVSKRWCIVKSKYSELCFILFITSFRLPLP